MTTTTVIPPTAPRYGLLRYPFTKRFARDLGYMLLTLATSIVAFTVWVTGGSLALSLAVLIVGVPVVIGVAYLNRGVAEMQRRLSGGLLGQPIPSVYRPRPDGLLAWVKVTLTDPQTWRDLLWLIFDSIVGFMFAVIVVTMLGVVLGSLFLPAWWWSMPGDAVYGLVEVNTTGVAFFGTAVGLVLFYPAVLLTRAMARGHAQVARLLLGPTSRARVEDLTRSRAGAVDVAHEELQRIERDLHDGAQARLVALAMDLGMAERKITEDPEATRELIGEAREETLRALGDLRELVRGIGPSILRDRGLEAAIASLTAGRSQPIDIRVHVGDSRPTDTVEAAAYFVVAEAIANAAKHSGATRVSVRVWRDVANRVVVEVGDDGHGGADPEHGHGLAGLSKRVRALDGTLAVTSPPGGPTTIRAEIPCE